VDERLHVADKVSLDAPSAIEIQVEVRHGGLDVVMSQAVFDLGDVPAPVKHIHCAAVTKAVNGVDMLEPFRLQCL